jgi:hypothetical protein
LWKFSRRGRFFVKAAFDSNPDALFRVLVEPVASVYLVYETIAVRLETPELLFGGQRATALTLLSRSH